MKVTNRKSHIKSLNSQNLQPILERNNPGESTFSTKVLAMTTPQGNDTRRSQDSIFETFGKEDTESQLLPQSYYGENASLMPTQPITSSSRNSSRTFERPFGAYSIQQNLTERPRHNKFSSVDDITESAIFVSPQEK